MKNASVDKPLLISVVVLVIVGLFIFSSASLGLLARDGARLGNVAFTQTFFGLFLGTIACLIATRINYRKWRKLAFYLFIGSLIVTAFVFTDLGFEHGGARRWINLGMFSFQPSEILKVGFIIYLAAWISGVKQKVSTLRYGLIPFFVLTGLAGALLLSQPDTDTFVVIFCTGVAMLLAGGGSWRHLFVIFMIGAISIGMLAYTRPYVKDRINTFINPSHDSLGSGYQIQQSLIAIGSGQLTGKGFGQSVQKFSFLPEPIGDSIFAVFAEEFGFIGSVGLIALYLIFAFRGFKIAINAPDTFGGLVALGIVILILSQSFVNMGSMLGVLPLSGIPLLFVSHGGTALFMTLAEVGILLNISRFSKHRSNHR